MNTHTMAQPAASVYVYYRVPAGTVVEPAVARIRAMQFAVAQRTGVATRLLRRVEDPGTWMEIYDGIAELPRFAEILSEEVAHAGLAQLIAPDSARHVEHFVDLPPSPQGPQACV